MHRKKREDGLTEIYTDNKFEEFAWEHVIVPAILAIAKLAATCTGKVTIEKFEKTEWEKDDETNQTQAD